MKDCQPRLADIHLHLYGSIHWRDFLAFVKSHSVDWNSYENYFNEVYGKQPPIGEVLNSCNRGLTSAEQEFQDLFVYGEEDAGSFARFQAKYNMLIAGSAWAAFAQGNSSLSMVINEVCNFMRQILERQLAEGIGYAEQRMTLNPRFSTSQARELLLGMLRTYSEYEGSDIQPRLAISLPRDDPWPHWELITELALGRYGHLLTGVDFCYFEEGHPPKKQREFFDAVKDFNCRHPERALAILYHVGESFVDKSLESAVRWVHEAAEMCAHRLGHAIALGVHPQLYGVHSRQEYVEERIDHLNYDLRHREGLARMGVNVSPQVMTEELEHLRSLPRETLLTVEYHEPRLAEVRVRQRYAAECIKASGSVVEVCPTSNRRIGGIVDGRYHPVQAFVEFGLPFVVGSDDPGIFNTTLAREIESVIEIADLQEDSFNELAARSWLSRSEVLTGRIQDGD